MSPDAEALLESVRDADDPTPHDAWRVLDAVYASVGAGAGAGAGLGIGAGASKATKLFAAWGLVGWKSGVVVLALVSAGVSALHGSRAQSFRSLRPSLEARTRAVADTIEASTVTPSVDVPPTKKRSPTDVPSHVPAPPSLRDEVLFLARVQAALKRGDGETALVLLDAHRTSDQKLVAERQAALVLSLCAVGRANEARVAGAEFLRQNADSPQRTAVERSCAGEDSSGAR